MEPLILAGGVAITEGVKFLYAQAAELLRRRRERADAEAVVPPEGAFVEAPGALEANPEVVSSVADELTALLPAISNVGLGLVEVGDGSDPDLLLAATALRRVMEVVYGQRLTFAGEERAPAGPVIDATIEARRVSGDVAVVRARLIESGKIVAVLKADEVTGEATAVKADRIG